MRSRFPSVLSAGFLRDRLIAHDVEGAILPLGRLREVAAADGADHELRAEYERWAFRFELLAA